MFVGEKLANIRSLHGYSRQELATKLNLTEQAIWQYENGYVSPSLDNINQLKNLFKVKVKYFYSKQDINGLINENNIAYRSSERSSRQRTKAEKIHLEYLENVLTSIEEHIVYPRGILNQLRDYAIDYKNKNSYNQNNKSVIIEHIAMYAREKIGLTDNNDNLLFLLEKSGAFIFEKMLGSKIDAYSTWSKTERPFIVLGNKKRSSVRRNFDLVHELAHLLLHHQMDIADFEKKEHDEIEAEADLFAANFLLPKEKFLEDLLCINKLSNPDSYIELKKKWKVSIAAIGHRVHDLGIMSYQQYRYFNVLLHRKGYKIKEPLDNEIPIMRPGKVRSGFQIILEKNFTSVDNLLSYFNFELELLADLLNIEMAFFEKYKGNKPITPVSYFSS